MKTIVLLSLLLFPFSLAAQPEKPAPAGKGATPLAANSQQPMANGTTRAVVIGISDYQSTGIPDLRFADRDAQAFAIWLQSPAGGNVPAENIRLLTGDKAKNAQIVADLDGLAENAQEGDLIIIYFSGHGDVETKTFNQLGFLLAWDSAPTNYKAGAYSLGYLQDVVSTISLLKKARVVVVTDACHAGKLAGSTFGGTQLASTNLAKQFANEVKIMSCQPNELALEGEQWGGGRGVFSYNLIEGLTGLADKNADAAVSLYEIDRYLGDVVPAQTAPHSQIPMVAGDKQFILAQVDAPSLTALRDTIADRPGGIAATGGKGFAEGLLADADSALLRLYRDFETALEKGDLLSGSPSADELYARLSKEEKLRPLHGLMRRNLAAALQNEPQQALNALLADDPYEANNYKWSPSKYATYPAYLQRSLELLGDKHYMYRPILSKMHFFEGYNLARSLVQSEAEPALRDSLKEIAKTKYQKALQLEPGAAYLYHAIGRLYMNNLPNHTDSLVVWCGRAVELAPGWALPMLDIFYEYKHVQSDLPNAEQWIERALEVKPNNYLVQEQLSWLRQAQGRTDDVLAICRAMIEEKPDLLNAYITLAYTHYQMTGDYREAERNFELARTRNVAVDWTAEILARIYIQTRRCRQSISLLTTCLGDTNLSTELRGAAMAELVEAYTQLGDFDAAERWAKKLFDEKWGIANDQVFGKTWLGRMRLLQHRPDEAAAIFRDALQTDPAPDSHFITDYACLGEAARMQNQPEQAEAFYKQAVAYNSLNLRLDMPVKEEAWFLYGRFLLGQNRLAEAADCFQKSMDMRKYGPWGEYGFALLAARKGKQGEALDWLEKSLDNFYPDSGSILAEPLFEKIRKTKRFRELLAKHFPGEGK